MKNLDIDHLLSITNIGQSKWELDNVVWNERSTNPVVLKHFLERIKELDSKTRSAKEDNELNILKEFAESMDQDECVRLLSNDDDTAQQQFIESVARRGALDTLCNNKISMSTMNDMCKLSPSDFILAAKRSQDIINSIRELVIQGETLSDDVAGA